MPTTTYDADFFHNLEEGAIASAEIVLPLVSLHFPVHSVVDFGCGNGTWLSVWKRLGVQRVQGVDGSYVDRNTLCVEQSEFTPGDLSQPIDLHETFDLVQSLEVGEHIHSSSAEVFVDSLVRHGRQILFSAAVPGQLGVDHVNERPYEYWRDLFAKRNYVMLDAIRPAIRDQTVVKWWYRYNTFLFVEKSQLEKLSPKTLETVVKETDRVPDIAPWWCKAGRNLTRLLTVRDSTKLANWFLNMEAKQAAKAKAKATSGSKSP